MNKGIPPGEPGDVLDWLHERGRRRAAAMPDFDASRSLSRARAAWDAGAVNFWSVLSPTERQHFASASRLRVVPPGTVLMREGEQAGEVFVICDGWTKVTVREGGQEHTVAERGPGDLIGEAGTEPGNLRSASVTAVSQVRALVMTTDGYAAFIADHPNVPDLVEKQTHDRGTGRPGRP
jgi:CRP-like cAMP-binding protein